MTAAPLIALALALAPAGAPGPDPAPQAHHRHVTMLPACARIKGIPAGYVVELNGRTIICAGWWR